jgi:hypothetical protein
MTGVYGIGVRSDSLRRRFAPPPLAAHAQRYILIVTKEGFLNV